MAKKAEKKKEKTIKQTKKISPKKPVKKEKVRKTTKGKKGAHKTVSLPEILKKTALSVLNEKKAEQIVSIDVRGRSSLADYIIIASGGSARQLAALTEHLCKEFSKVGSKKTRVEGLAQGNWVLIDTGDIIVHLFRPEVRRYYSIDNLWQSDSGDTFA